MFINLNKNIYTHVKNSEKSREKKHCTTLKMPNIGKPKKLFWNLSFLKQVLYYINEIIYLCLINKLLMRHLSDTLIKIN